MFSEATAKEKAEKKLNKITYWKINKAITKCKRLGYKVKLDINCDESIFFYKVYCEKGGIRQ